MRERIDVQDSFEVPLGGTRASQAVVAPIGGWSKRAFDIFFSIAAIASFGALLVLIAVAIRALSRGPVFFTHERVGFGGEKFLCLKFRTMTPNAAEQLAEILSTDPGAHAEYSVHHKLRNDPRIIPGIGTFLRKSSLDELPQFFNVLCGHMSVVGPRPVTREEFHKYGDAAEKYSSARPGITGLWQTSGRSTTTFRERVRRDCEYLDSWSMAADLKIILKTIFVLSKGAC